jgi:hypothetical protein
MRYTIEGEELQKILQVPRVKAIREHNYRALHTDFYYLVQATIGAKLDDAKECAVCLAMVLFTNTTLLFNEDMYDIRLEDIFRVIKK